MRPGLKTLLGATLLAPGLLIALQGPRASLGDEPGRLGRLFRFGGGFGTGPAAPAPATPAPTLPSDQPPAMLFSAPSSSGAGASAGLGTGPGIGSGAATGGASAPGPRILPQPRVSRAATESDPILTRVSLVRSSDGNQFGMALQIYADGTVLDNEGVHHLSQSDLKPLLDVLQSGDLYRLRGHCGAPATDFIEQVYLVVYERSLGRLRANAFSYSGNPQGCDHAVRHLHAALETLQARLSRPAMTASAAHGSSGPPPVGAVPPPPPVSGPSIPLTTTP